MRDDETLRASLAETTAMGRIGEPYDIGEAIAAVTAPAAGWMTGQRIEVSGGALL